jgi:coenzyme F420-reducing hydrogenase beta subunit
LLVIVLAFVLRPKKQSTVIVNNELIENIFSSVQKDNILQVESEISRVKIDVKDVDVVNLDLLKEISEGVFISGKSLKIMFKDSAEDIVEGLKRGL